MGLLDDVLREQAQEKKPCKVGRLIAEMPKQDAADLQAALLNPKVQTEALTRVLNQHGYPIASTTLANHRRGDCCCGTK